MKNLLKILWIAPLLLMFNCGDDDDESNNVIPQADNVLIVGDVSYDLEWGSLLNFGEFEPGIINIDLELWSTGIIEPESGCDVDEGEGQGLYFEMFTSNETSLDDGTYTYNMDPALTTWDYGDYNLNISSSNSDTTDDLWVVLESGTVSIEKTGSNYNISWDLVDVNNVSITGTYSGSLNYCDIDGGNLQPNGSSKRSNN
jgi:hypothetical protein